MNRDRGPEDDPLAAFLPIAGVIALLILLTAALRH